MRRYCALLLSLCAAALARGGEYPTDIRLYKGYPVLYDYTELNETTEASALKSRLVTGEYFRAFVVHDTREDRSTDPCAFDAAGEIVPAEGLTAADFKWCTLTVQSDTGHQTEQWKKVTTALGVPAGAANGTVHEITASAAERFKAGVTDETNVFLYLVAFDTRNAQGVCEADRTIAPKPICRYAMRKCLEVGKTSQMFGLAWTVSVGYDLGEEVDASVDLPGCTVVDGVYANAWKAVAPFQSLTITEAGETKTLTGDELIAYLTPTLSGFTTEAPAAAASAAVLDDAATSSAAFYLSATSPDLCYYALETKGALGDAQWEGFNDFLSRKGLDNATEKDYTRCRIDGTSPLAIPVVEGETARFYRLRVVTQ